MLIIESKQFIVPVVYHSHLIYFIGFWNEIGKVFIPSMDVIEFVNLHGHRRCTSSAYIKPQPEKGYYHVILFEDGIDGKLSKIFKNRLLLSNGKLTNTLKKYWNMTYADNRK